MENLSFFLNKYIGNKRKCVSEGKKRLSFNCSVISISTDSKIYFSVSLKERLIDQTNS